MNASSEVLMNAYEAITDLADVAEIGTNVLGIKTGTIQRLLDQGETFLSNKENHEELIKNSFIKNSPYYRSNSRS